MAVSYLRTSIGLGGPLQPFDKVGMAPLSSLLKHRPIKSKPQAVAYCLDLSSCIDNFEAILGIMWREAPREMLASIVTISLERMMGDTTFTDQLTTQPQDANSYGELLRRITDVLSFMLELCADECYGLIYNFIPTKHPDGSDTELAEIRVVSDTQVLITLK